jgi:hypothetical protein
MSRPPSTPAIATIHSLRDADNRPVLVESQLQAKYGVSSGFSRHWSRQVSRHHPPEPALRSSTIPNPHPFGGDGPTCKGWWVEDAERILTGEEDRRPDRRGCGRRRPGRHAHFRLGLPDDASAADLLKKYLTPGPRATPEVLAWASEKRIAHSRLRRAQAVLKVMSRAPERLSGKQGSEVGVVEYWRLPGQEPHVLETRFASSIDTFLRGALANGPVPAGEVLNRGKKLKFSRKCLYKARELLGVEFRRGYRGKPYWCLPGQELPAQEPLGPERRAILAILRGGNILTTKEIAHALGKK